MVFVWLGFCWEPGMRLVNASIGIVNNTFEIYQVKSVY